MKKYPDISELIRMKEEWRRQQAARPIEEKIETVNRLRRSWDKKLDEHGIDAVIWASGEETATEGARKITFILKERVENSRWSDNRLKVDQQLIANADQTRYEIMQVPQELKDHGIENVWVEISSESYYQSAIHIKMKDLAEPIIIIKRYR